MKKIIYVAIFAVMALFAQDALAQAKNPKEVNKAKHEELMNTRLQMLKDELKLTDVQYVAFEPVYREYRKTIAKVADNKGAKVRKEELTNENALKVAATRLSNTINTSSVKQKYLWIFAEVIEPLQVEKLYRIEDRISREARKVAQYK
ncbi:MAG: hypothetical protein IJX65_02380 [Alistipes sp.]|nr:hypothetical protein [Alistipes sp.]